jgi:hypothetical protein
MNLFNFILKPTKVFFFSCFNLKAVLFKRRKQVWWCSLTIISTLVRLRQEDLEFEANLGLIFLKK